MTEPVTLSVSVSDAVSDARVPVAVRSRLALEDGDTVTVTRGIGDSVTTVVTGDESVQTGHIVLPSGIASRLGVSGGESVTVAVADTAAASAVTVAPVPRLTIHGGEQLVRDSVADEAVSVGDTVSISLFDGALDVPIRVVSVSPTGSVVITDSTEVVIEDGPAPLQGVETMTTLPPTAVGGYESTVGSLRTAVADLVSHQSTTRGESTRRAGVVLTGPHGVGKTHLLRHVAWLTNTSISRVGPQKLIEGGVDSAVDALHSAGTAVQESGQGIVHLDRLDTVVSETDGATAAALRDWVEQLRSATGVAVVAEVTDESVLPVGLTCGGLLSRVITVPEPSQADRTDILRTLAGTDLGETADCSAIGRRAFGYVAADLVDLWLTAVEHASAETGRSGSTAVTQADLVAALESTEPAGMDGVTHQIPDVTFDDIGGLDEAKRELRRTVEWPLTRPELFDALNIDAPAGLLLYGPPGTGKTLLARAVASTSDANFIPVNGPEVMDRYVGESERAVRRLFDRARANAPTVVFFDELDAIGASRTSGETAQAAERVVSQLLTELDGIGGRDEVIVIGATNRPERLDDALLRPGRFDRTVSVGMPDVRAREEIFRVHTAPYALGEAYQRELAERTDGYTGSDIAAVVREAGLLAIEEAIEASSKQPVDRSEIRLSADHFERALERVKPALTPTARQRYESLDGFGQRGER